MITETITIEGMSCGHCVSSVTGAVSSLPGVADVAVSLDDKNAVVTFDEAAVTRSAIADVIEELGFTVKD